MARVGQFSLLSPGERLSVLDAREKALTAHLAHLTAMHGLSAGDRWASAVTSELISRIEQERGWLATLRVAGAGLAAALALPTIRNTDPRRQPVG